MEVFGSDETYLLNPKNSFASPTPVLDPDGERVYVHFGASGTAAVSTSGNILWRTRFPYISQHGNGGSPILHNGRLVVSIDGYDTAYLVALDARTGEERWRSPRPDPVSQAYSTPLLIRVADRDQIFKRQRVPRQRARPGDRTRDLAGPLSERILERPRPIYGHGLVYLSTGFQSPTLLAVRPTARVTSHGRTSRGGSGAGHRSHPSPILVGDELYVVTDFGIATCVDALTGDVHWQQRLGGNHSASPVFVNGRIYFQNEEGVTTVLAPGPEFRVLARNRLDGLTLASMAVADGALFIRSDSHLYRIEERP